MKRILMTADAVGGVWTYALALAAALAERGCETHLAVMGPPPRDAQRAAARERGVRVIDRPFALEWMPSPWDDVERAGEWLLALEREIEPDVVHVNGFAHAALPFRAPVVLAAHSDVVTWWRACRGGEPDASWDRYRAEVRRGLRAARAIVAPSHAMLDGLLAAHDPEGRHRARARVIANTVDPIRFRRDARKVPFVLGAGRVWDEAKDLALLDAVAGGLELPVVIAGDDTGPDGARRKLRHAISLGTLSSGALARWMARAACFASPARYEPFGLCALEAALSGCALVLSDLPSFREIWGDAALFVRAGDHEGWQDALRAVLEDAPAREVIASRAHARALELAKPSRFAAEHLDLYASVEATARSTAGRSACA